MDADDTDFSFSPEIYFKVKVFVTGIE